MMALFAKINPGVIWLLIAIATDVLSTFYSAKVMAWSISWIRVLHWCFI